ncbi:MAG: hypothetical protein JHC84_18740 [Solirubrobacteraceae bacterium]|nr:hypothetical protein [Solirubrobacteraceae bacterium]
MTTTGKQFFLSDRLGSTTGLTEVSGAIVRRYVDNPDGNATSPGSGASTDLRYAGGHTVGGYYDYAARYYDPETMRWTQQYPLNQIADLAEANRYAYVGSDPVNHVDPEGLAQLPARGSRAARRSVGGCAKYGGDGACAKAVAGTALGAAGVGLIVGGGGPVGAAGAAVSAAGGALSASDLDAC